MEKIDSTEPLVTEAMDGVGVSTAAQPEDYFAPGKAAQNEYGVLYQAEWETPWDGTAIAARLHARALAAQGIPVLLKSFSGLVVNDEGIPEPVLSVGIPDVVKAEVGPLTETSIQTLAVVLRHLVVRSASALETYLMPRHAIHADPEKLLIIRKALYDSTIAYTVWERDRVSPGIAQQLARCGQLWVPCRQNASMLVRSGVPADKVHVVPHPYEPTDSICRLTERRPYAEKRFYAVGRWEPRKGFHELIGAFLAAFRPGDGASLTIKTTSNTWRGYVTPEQSVAAWLKQFDYWKNPETVARQLTIDTRRYPRSRILKLHFDHNIYVSSSHAEAWGLPSFEAKLAGNRLVHIPSGSSDYCDTEDIAVPYGMEPVHPSYGWEKDAQWASVSADALAAAMKKVTAPTTFVRPAHYERVFGFDAVGRQMADLILSQLDTVEPKAAVALRRLRRT